jgi:hypothetical protein
MKIISKIQKEIERLESFCAYDTSEEFRNILERLKSLMEEQATEFEKEIEDLRLYNEHNINVSIGWKRRFEEQSQQFQKMIKDKINLFIMMIRVQFGIRITNKDDLTKELISLRQELLKEVQGEKE